MYLILEPDGSKASMYFVGDDKIQNHLDGLSQASENGCPDPVFLEEIPVGDYGVVDPGMWPEGTVLILKVQVVVPRPVTQKWSI